MPSGTPSPNDILDQHVVAFALDTSIIQEHGYRFDEAPLSYLARQLPPWMRLYLSEVVVKEVLSHQVAQVASHVGSARSSLKSLERAGFDVSQISNALSAAPAAQSPEALFKQRIEAFVKRHSGVVIAVAGEKLAERVFERYFGATPPFGATKERKSEFPDAVALLTLEAAALRHQKSLIAVSRDKAWADFAAKSDAVFCVESLDKLTELFTSNSQTASAIEGRLVKILDTPSSHVLKSIERSLESQLPEFAWTADAYSGMSARLEPEVVGVALEHVSALTETVHLWMSPDDHTECVVELELDVRAEFHVEATFYICDPIDKDELSAGTGSTFKMEDFTVTAFLRVSGDLLDGDPATWEVTVDFADPSTMIEAGEIELDYGVEN